MKRSKGSLRRAKTRRAGKAGFGRGSGRAEFQVSSDGRGLASHAPVVMLSEVAEGTGLARFVTAALADTYRGPWIHSPGQVFADLACAIADGATSTSGVRLLRDRPQLHGLVASQPTTWRLLNRVDGRHLDLVRAARGLAREQAWQAGAAPDWAAPSFPDRLICGRLLMRRLITGLLNVSLLACLYVCEE